jgi:PAS domain S-box-containing protein
MRWDLHTAVTLFMWLALVSAFLLMAMRWIRGTHPGHGRWAIAGMLLVLSLFLLSLRSLAPDWISIVSANAGIAIAAILYLEGAREFRSLAPRSGLAYAGGVVAIGAVAFYCYIVPSMNARAAVMSTFLGIVLTVVSITLLREIPSAHRFGQTLTGCLFGLCAATLVVRAFYCYFGPPLSDRNALSGLHGVFFLATVTEMASFSLGLTLLMDERVTSDLFEVKERASRASEEVIRHVANEAVLRESEQRFRTLADTAPVMVWMSGPDKLCTFFNKPWLDFRGRSLEQELGKGWVEGVHPDDLDRCSAIYNSAFASRKSFRKECRLRRADGEYRWVLDHGTPLYRGGEFAGFIGSCVDITEQKLVEERLGESEGRLKKAERLAHLGHWNWDAKINKAICSEEYCRIFGQPMDHAPSFEEFLNLVVPKDRERVGQVIRDALAQKIGYTVEFQIVRPTGDYRTIRSVAEVLLDNEGVLAWLLGTCQDITEIRRAQEESFSRQKLETMGTLASGIAHDFNNLLGSVVAQADLALAEFEAGASPTDELKGIRDVAMRGSEIVRQLMIYAGKESPIVGLVDLSKVVEEMLALLKVSVSKHAVLKAELGQDLPPTRASAAQIRQIVMNLVTNASDAIGDRDGLIRVITRRSSQWRESVAASESLSEADYLLLEVSDTGCGMSRETQDRVFDPFFTTKSAGRGLGLAVVDGIVRGLGGTIRVTSEPGQGTTFQTLLPCAETTVGVASHAMSAIDELVSSSKQATVLIVEDEDALRRAVAKMLRNNGFEVLEADDGSTAIDLLRAAVDKIDMVLLDMTIPGASSAQVVAEAAKTRPDIRVILTSAYSQEMVTAALSASQICDFIRKPFQIGDLIKMLRRAASA